jgi:hypothetical protein
VGDRVRLMRGARALVSRSAPNSGRRLEDAGVDRSVAMRITGHKTESMYLRYAGVRNSRELQDAAGKVQAYRDSRELVQNPVHQGAPYVKVNLLDLWSWRRDLNPRPSDYKSDALPTELRQPTFTE